MIDAERANIMKLTSTRVAALALVIAGAGICGWGVVIAQQPASRSHTPVSKQQIEKWKNELSNWGRWGKDDERGALNLITPAKRKQAAALAKTGQVVPLGHPLVTEKGVDAPTPYALQLRSSPTNTIATDRQDISPHGRIFSHIDALCHVGTLDGKLYNGVPFQDAVTTDHGCVKMGIGDVTIVTRAILVDIPRLK